MAGRNIRVIKFQTDYKIQNNKPVKLKVDYGYAQVGGSAVKLAGTPIPDEPPKSECYNFPTPAAGQLLLIKSVVSDVNDATNKCSAIYSLAGGVVDQQFTSEGETEQDGDPILFYAWITFVA